MHRFETTSVAVFTSWPGGGPAQQNRVIMQHCDCGKERKIVTAMPVAPELDFYGRVAYREVEP